MHNHDTRSLAKLLARAGRDTGRRKLEYIPHDISSFRRVHLALDGWESLARFFREAFSRRGADRLSTPDRTWIDTLCRGSLLTADCSLNNNNNIWIVVVHISRARCTHPRTHSRTRACVRAYIPSHRPRLARVAHPFTRSHVAPLYTIASHRVYTRTHAMEDLSPFRTDTVKRLNGPLCARSRVPSWGSRCSKDSIGFNDRFDLDCTPGKRFLWRTIVLFYFGDIL